MTLTVGSLFSGIGGLDLGLERSGMRVIWQSEIDPYACKVLSKHWPEVVNHGNIKDIDWDRVERPDIICGGYPCQPFSLAGSRQGEDDPRHLWPFVRHAISRLRPRYAILENVRGHLSLGGTTVVAELASLGYDCEWRVVSASSVGAAHRRDRIIIVAYPNDTGSGAPGCGANNERTQKDQGRKVVALARSSGCGEAMADTNGEGLQRSVRSLKEEGQSSVPSTSRSHGRKEIFDPRHIEHIRATSTANKWWEVEPNVGRVADGIPSRMDRLKGLGNAVVPQVAEVVGQLVMMHHQSLSE